MPIRVFMRDSPQRAIALATDTHVLVFRQNPSSVANKAGSTLSVNEGAAPKCIVEFSPWEDLSMQGYRSLSSLSVQGTLGLVTLNNDVFLCVVNGSSKAATLRPGETVQRILSVEFHCLTRSDYDRLLDDQVNAFPTDDLDADGWDHGGHKEPLLEHPCLALKKLLSGGSFYYSADFDVTKRLQDRSAETSTVALDSLDAGFLWNAYMIQPLVDFRSRLSQREKDALDDSRILTSAIRGFAYTVAVPAAYSPARNSRSGMPSMLTLISRLSCRRAGTRFNARGIDDDGNVANFVETETIYCTPALSFSYVQCRGSIPIFWEQAAGLPGQQKVTITRSLEATQPAFDKHFETLFEGYGDVFVVNLLSEEKPNEVQLTRQYEYHIKNTSLNAKVDRSGESEAYEHKHITHINFDFHAETRGANGYDAASGIKRYLRDSARAFEYFLAEEVSEPVHKDGRKHSVAGQNDILKQAGVFRTNCLDCLDRTNLIQTIISRDALELFLSNQHEDGVTSDFWARHGTLWADCGDALSKIYAGTGALKSSFTRSGKSSFAGALADLRKSAQRLYINNFEDKGRQNVIDMLLGRLIGQMPVILYDPINDWVMTEMNKRAAEFTAADNINIFVGTFNLNGKTAGIEEDLSSWLCPNVADANRVPEIVAIAFQEIVELDVQQIMSTDPHRRQAWENAVRKTLNANARKYSGEEYVSLRGGQLVGASLSVFVKASALPYIKNVEGAVKKTGMSGMAGNKGAVAIRMEYAGTSICLVTAHLAAGFANYQERNQDYKTIAHGLRFQRQRGIEDHDSIIWFGDFNYRIGLDNEKVRSLIRLHDLSTLYENDQLNIQMVHGHCFPHYFEQQLTFLPTYKFNLGTDDYDTSEKTRIPAWCDRILTRGANLRQLAYDSAPLKFSDHRPVWGLFRCTVSVVDQVKKDRINNELYQKRRDYVGTHTAGQGTESDDESLYGYESIEPGLPPASSDKRKWWLDNGMPARSRVQPPSQYHSLNPSRPSNPFTPTNEPDWVKVEAPTGTTPPTRSVLLHSNQSAASPREQSRGQQVTRKLPPPFTRQEETPPEKPKRPAAYGTDGAADYNPNPVHLKQTLRKPAPPPKPTKPNLLRSESQQSTASARNLPPPAPEPRRAHAVSPVSAPKTHFGLPPLKADGDVPPTAPPRKPISNLMDDGPPLPPRRAATGLMDADESEELKDWTPLKPQ